jgi:hypothetical protein
VVGVDRIEIVDRAGEMLKAHPRRGAFLAEMPVGEAHTADILELGRRGFAVEAKKDSASAQELLAKQVGTYDEAELCKLLLEISLMDSAYQRSSQAERMFSWTPPNGTGGYRESSEDCGSGIGC